MTDGPRYHFICVDADVRLSPSRAETGITASAAAPMLWR